MPKAVENSKKYLEALKPIPSILKDKFPLLKMVSLPTRTITTSFIQGILLPKYLIEELHLLPEQYDEFGLPIFANIPEDFQVVGLEVYDSCKRIDWGKVPYNIKHCHYPSDQEKECGFRKICTHKPEYINTTNCVENVLFNAFYLFQEYKRYDISHKFELECLPHGNKNEQTIRI